MPCPRSTLASSATIVVSTMFGSEFVSTTFGTLYALPPDVALPGCCETIREMAAAAARARASTTKRRRCHQWAIVLDICCGPPWSCSGGPAPTPHGIGVNPYKRSKSIHPRPGDRDASVGTRIRAVAERGARGLRAHARVLPEAVGAIVEQLAAR